MVQRQQVLSKTHRYRRKDMALMEDTAVHFLTAILSLVILVLYLHGRSKKVFAGKHKFPPGSMGWPLIGENIQFLLSTMSDNYPRSFIYPRQLRYGDIFSSSLFGRRVIVSVNLEFNKFVLQNEGRLFQTSNPQSFIDITGKYSLLALRGDLQRKIHGITVNLLNHENLCSHLMDDTQNLLINAMSGWDGKKMKLQDECHQIILDLMAKQLLDLSPSKETEEIARQFHKFSAAVVCLPLRIPGSTFYRGLKARRYLLNKIYEIMGERRKHPEVVHNDLLSKFLKEDPPLSDEIVVDSLLFLLFAGHETVSRSMAMSIKYLSDCPRALKQLQDEQDHIVKSNANKKLSWDAYKSMKFTQYVINEVLRMGNVAPFLFREATQDIDFKGYQIPKGQTILVFTSGVHTDDKNYAAAFEFNPWRWETCENGVSNNPLFAPFGGGGRLCPGSNLARLELSLFLHHFVTKFRWNVLVKDKISNLPFPHMIKGLPLQLYSRG